MIALTMSCQCKALRSLHCLLIGIGGHVPPLLPCGKDRWRLANGGVEVESCGRDIDDLPSLVLL